MRLVPRQAANMTATPFVGAIWKFRLPVRAGEKKLATHLVVSIVSSPSRGISVEAFGFGGSGLAGPRPNYLKAASKLRQFSRLAIHERNLGNPSDNRGLVRILTNVKLEVWKITISSKLESRFTSLDDNASSEAAIQSTQNYH